MATRDLSLERERILRILNKGLSRVTAVLQAERTEVEVRTGGIESFRKDISE